MPTTALYRVSSLEVVKISVVGQLFADRDQARWGVLTDPALPDGRDTREVNGDGTLGPLRALGFSKVAVLGSNTVRNATGPEIATFAPAQAADEAAQDVAEAGRMLTAHPRFRRLLKAMLKRIIAENNAQAAQWNAFRAQVSAASSLSDLKTRVANNTTDIPTRTLAQAVTALQGDLSPND